jgi:hypothetical protein
MIDHQPRDISSSRFGQSRDDVPHHYIDCPHSLLLSNSARDATLVSMLMRNFYAKPKQHWMANTHRQLIWLNAGPKAISFIEIQCSVEKV